MTISKTVQQSNIITTTDIDRWGTNVVYEDEYEREPGTAILCEPNQAIMDERGKITTCKKGKLRAAFVDPNKDLRMVNPDLLSTLPGENVISADDVKIWKQREQNLSNEQKRLLRAWVCRHFSYEHGEEPDEDMIDNWMVWSIAKKQRLDARINEQEQYESLSPNDQRELDTKIIEKYRSKRHAHNRG